MAAPVRLRVDDNLLLAHRIVVECQFVLPTEEESAALRAPMVETEDGLVEMAVQGKICDRFQ